VSQVEEEDVALKLVHTADWHLGRRFPTFDEVDQTKLTRARLEAVRRVLDLADRYSVDAVLCAGDLFDDPDPRPEWWKGLVSALADRAWHDRPVFLLPGNHDPLTSKSIYAASHEFRQQLPEWVHVVDRDDFSFELSEDAVLYAAPCRSAAGQKDLALSLPDREPGDARIRIGMVHGSTFDIDNFTLNFPIARDAAVQRGLDYLAIGDTHSFRCVPEGARIPTIYPSAPEPTTFGEKDSGFAALVLFRRRGRKAIVEKQRVATWTWRVETCRSIDELRRLRDEGELRQCVLRLVLDFEVSVAEYDEVRNILESMKGTEVTQGSVGIMQIEESELRLAVSDAGDAFEDLPEVLAATVTRLQAMSDGPDGEKAKRALWHLYRAVRAGSA
jgi:DNA repair exonuclease SbcCD nuclease subunit